MRGPILVVYPDGVWYHHLDEELLDRIVEEHLRQGRPVLDRAFYVPGAGSDGEP
jgi:(2Fe-2S) ferredoxin